MRRGRTLAERQVDLLARRFRWWKSLSSDEVARLQRLIVEFLKSKTFEGTRGFTPTEEMQLLIAAQACLLILGLDLDWYRDVTSIVVSPAIVESALPRKMSDGVIAEGHTSLSGQAMLHGPVLIAWDAARADTLHPERGHNVVFHEFAHKLDMRNGAADGEPPMTRELAANWRHVMSDLMTRLRADGAPLIRHYGETNPAELMAVVTEAFFLIPAALRDAYPTLYELFTEFYRQDPAEWSHHV